MRQTSDGAAGADAMQIPSSGDEHGEEGSWSVTNANSSLVDALSKSMEM